LAAKSELLGGNKKKVLIDARKNISITPFTPEASGRLIFSNLKKN
jgi:hypothetical protein